MKKTLAIAIVLASITTYAQVESTAPAASDVPVATASKSKVKKVSKKKKAAKPSAAIEATAIPVAATAPATATIAAGTTTATTAEVAAPTKKWGVAAKVFSSNDFTEMQNIQTLTSVGFSYKVADKVTLKATETFETLSASSPSEDKAKRDMISANNFRAAYTDISAATTLGTMMGSGDITTSLNLKVIGDDSYYTTLGGYKNVASMVEANLSIPYSIAPKVDVSIDSQWRHVLNEAGPNSNRFLVIPSISYTFNDMFSVYQAGGLIISARDNSDFRRNYERIYLETGFTVTPIKNLAFGMDINQDKAITSSNDNIDVTSFSLYRPNQAANADKTLDSVTYETYVSYSF
ncbi:MAG: hypothetical protein WA160_03445 [Pseudobdellovibrio sp.]